MTTEPSALIFMDTETTGLSLTDDIWEFAAVRREPDGTEVPHHLFIEHSPSKCAALPESFAADHKRRYDDGIVVTRREAAQYIHDLVVDRPHIVGAVPNFDTERLALMLGQYGFTWQAHYHLIDVENLAVGYLACKANLGEHSYRELITPPWNSDDLSRAVGVEPPGEGVRHTAMGDARWARAVYDAIMGGVA